VPIDGNQIFGPRDESLVFSDDIDNVPEEYRQVGTSILMESDRGQTRSFLVTHVDDEKLTVDGNNPLSGREVVFTLEILTVRDATAAEAMAGGAVDAGAAIDPSRLRPV
jgi:FKBP-type peptidyl-prolyl cis-trans isomerase SlyD